MLTKFSIQVNNILWLILSWGLVDAGAQNLVSNPSFEQFFILPANFTLPKNKNLELIPRWYFLNTPDYFNRRCTSDITRVPDNFAGNTSPKQGMAYAGLILCSDPAHYTRSPRYNEHLQNELDAPLEPGQLYCCSFYTRLAQNSGFAADGLGMIFTREQIRFEARGDAAQYQPQIENRLGNILTESEQWIEVSGLYRAEGGERYLTIGNFRTLEETAIHRIRIKLSAKMDYFAYYYIDLVSVVPVARIDQCHCTANSYTVTEKNLWLPPKNKIVAEEATGFADSLFGKIVYGKAVELKNIYFDFDKFDLLPQSNREIDKLYRLVAGRSGIMIELTGHTDTVGGSAYNLLLSHNRAKSVADYLIGKGLPASQISYYGYGSTVPVASNATVEGRTRNRRVEFVINKIHENPPKNSADADPFD